MTQAPTQASTEIAHSINPGAAMLAAMENDGHTPDGSLQIIADGHIHRFRVAGDKAGTRNGWYVLHPEVIPHGAYGSWRTGEKQTWCARGKGKRSPAEQERVRREAAHARAERARALELAHQAASDRAALIWQSSPPANPSHPYLRRKKIPSSGARQCGRDLLLRLIDFRSRRISSLQYIGEDGSKKLLRGGRKQGCVIHINGQIPGAKRVLICEGFATGASLAQIEPGSLVLAAIDAGNLYPVAIAARRKWPDIQLVICADADPVGVAKGREAAIAAGALMAAPQFPDGVEGSDWNDYIEGGLMENSEFHASSSWEGQ